MLHGTAGGEIQLRTGLVRRIAAVLILRSPSSPVGLRRARFAFFFVPGCATRSPEGQSVVRDAQRRAPHHEDHRHSRAINLKPARSRLIWPALKCPPITSVGVSEKRPNNS